MASAPNRKRRLFDSTYVRHERRKSYVLACILFWSVLTFLLLNRFVLATVEIVGPSMLPTLRDGDRHLMYRWTNYLREPRRGDIVAVMLPHDDQLSVKRIVGLPGETVRFDRGRVFVNDVALDESYLPEGIETMPIRYGKEALLLAPRQFFVLGDNRENSADSRFYGPVGKSAISGLIQF